MQEKIVEVLQQALRSSGKVKITFKPEATGYVWYLLRMNTRGIVKMSDEDKMSLQGVAECSRWHNDRTRTATLFIDDRTFNGHLFVDQMSYGLESIEVVNK